jgi:hypothetical protein
MATTPPPYINVLLAMLTAAERDGLNPHLELTYMPAMRSYYSPKRPRPRCVNRRALPAAVPRRRAPCEPEPHHHEVNRSRGRRFPR